MLVFLAACLNLNALPTPQRAMWTWHGKPLVEDPAARRQFFRFVNAPKGDAEHRITVIWLAEVDPSDSATSPQLADFIRECHRQGIRVDFLCGADTWAAPQENSIGVGMVKEVLQFNRNRPKDQQFDGFQFDVEPYALHDWPNPTLRAGFLALFDQSEKAIKSSYSHLLLGAAIPRWFGNADMGGLHKDILDRVDYVAVMDYVSTSENFIKDPVPILDYANSIGKKAWLGAEASKLPTEPMATFYAKGNAAMENAFATAEQTYRSTTGFAGVAIEYYETYAALRP